MDSSMNFISGKIPLVTGLIIVPSDRVGKIPLVTGLIWFNLILFVVSSITTSFHILLNLFLSCSASSVCLWHINLDGTYSVCLVFWSYINLTLHPVILHFL